MFLPISSNPNANRGEQVSRAAFVGVYEDCGSNSAILIPREGANEAEYVRAISALAEGMRDRGIARCYLSLSSISQYSEEGIGATIKLGKSVPVEIFKIPAWVADKFDKHGVSTERHNVSFTNIDPELLFAQPDAIDVAATLAIIEAAEKPLAQLSAPIKGKVFRADSEPALDHEILSRDGAKFYVDQDVHRIGEQTDLATQFKSELANAVALTDGDITLSLRGISRLGHDNIGAIIRADKICLRSGRRLSLVDIGTDLAVQLETAGLDRVIPWKDRAA